MLESWNMSTCNSTLGSCSILCESTASIPERILVNLRVTIALLFVSITAQVVTKDPPGVFFGWVCAARDSKLAPRSIKNFPLTWYPVLEMGQFFILRSRLQQEYNSVLVNALNRIFKSNLSLNAFKWLLTKVESFCAFEILYPVLETRLKWIPRSKPGAGSRVLHNKMAANILLATRRL